MAILIASPAPCKDGFGFTDAGVYYNVSPEVLQALSWVESRHNPQAINDKTYNGSQDRGHMQINEFWKSKIGAVGWELLDDNATYCTYVGAYVYANCVAKFGNSWEAVACYHNGCGFDETMCQGNLERIERGHEYVRKVQAYLISKHPLPKQKSRSQGRNLARSSGPSGRFEREQISQLRGNGVWQRIN
jgi:hypothetical protein